MDRKALDGRTKCLDENKASTNRVLIILVEIRCLVQSIDSISGSCIAAFHPCIPPPPVAAVRSGLGIFASSLS